MAGNGRRRVKFAEASAVHYESGNVVEWRTGYEVDNLGFNIYKEVAGKRSLATPAFVAGSALLASSSVEFTAGKPYVWVDKQAAPDTVYWIEDIDLNGTRTMHGPVATQAGKLAERFNSSSSRLADLNKSATADASQLEYPEPIVQSIEAAPATWSVLRRLRRPSTLRANRP